MMKVLRLKSATTASGKAQDQAMYRIDTLIMVRIRTHVFIMFRQVIVM